jgi:hypothetical protein
MQRLAISLCPACSACPEVVIEGDEVRIGKTHDRSHEGRVERPR